MVIGVIAKLPVKEDQAAAFEATFAALAKQVIDKEPGVLIYQLTKSRAEPGVYKVLEIYKDEAALKLHGATDYFKAAWPNLAGALAGKPEVEMLDGVG
jgi:quinol monooxygenase YgiN